MHDLGVCARSGAQPSPGFRLNPGHPPPNSYPATLPQAVRPLKLPACPCVAFVPQELELLMRSRRSAAEIVVWSQSRCLGLMHQPQWGGWAQELRAVPGRWEGKVHARLWPRRRCVKPRNSNGTVASSSFSSLSPSCFCLSVVLPLLLSFFLSFSFLLVGARQPATMHTSLEKG